MHLYNTKLFLFVSFFVVSLTAMDHQKKSLSIDIPEQEDLSPSGSPQNKMTLEKAQKTWYLEYDYPGCKEVRTVNTSTSSSTKLAQYCESCRRLSTGS